MSKLPLVIAAVMAMIASCQTSGGTTPLPTPVLGATIPAVPTANTPRPTDTPVPTMPATSTPTMVVTATSEPTVTPTIAKGPSLDDLVVSLPSEAKHLTIRELNLNGTKFFDVDYILNDTQYHDIYHWEGRWRRVFNMYDWAQRLFAPNEIGPIVDGKPQPRTARIRAEITLVENSADPGDVIVLEIGYTGGPGGMQRFYPTIAALKWNGADFVDMWHDSFEGRLVSAVGRYLDGGVQITVEAYLRNDPNCCPSGWRQIDLVPYMPEILREDRECTAERQTQCLPWP